MIESGNFLTELGVMMTMCSICEEFDGLSDKIVHCECVPTAEGHICKCCEVSGVALWSDIKTMTCSLIVDGDTHATQCSYERPCFQGVF